MHQYIEIETRIEVEDENGNGQNAQTENIVVNISYYDIYWNRKGKEIFRNPNNEEQDRTFIVKTDKRTIDIYPPRTPLPSVVVGIQKSVAENTEQTLSAQTNIKDNAAVRDTITRISANIVQIENVDVLWKMYKIALNDDGRGGINSANNREYGGKIRNMDNSVIPERGAQGNIDAGNLLTIQFNIGAGDRCWFHTHPSGTTKNPDIGTGSTSSTTKQISGYWQQPPSTQDVDNATSQDGSPVTNYVFAMSRVQTVYVYSSEGVLAIFPQSAIRDVYKQKQEAELSNLENLKKQEMNQATSKEDQKRIKINYDQQKEQIKNSHKEENSAYSFE